MTYLYKGYNITNIVYNNGTDSTQGYNAFPGLKSNTVNTIEQTSITTDYLYQNQRI